MKKALRSVATCGTFVFVFVAHKGEAFDPGANHFSSGEVSAVQSCFYECKQKQTPFDAADDSLVLKGVALEDTLLVLANEAPLEALIALVGIFDGNQNLRGVFKTHLSPMDLDVINVCRTLERAGIVPPQAGLLEIVTVDSQSVPEGGAYAWVKELALINADQWIRPAPPVLTLNRKLASAARQQMPLDRAFTFKYHSKVKGIAKTPCRVTPPEVADPDAVMLRFGAGKPVVPAYEQGTFDPPPAAREECSLTRVPCSTDPTFFVPCPDPQETCSAAP